ncbi:hypothetical protein [Streptomyces spiralis]|uniref:hypothetical protein n=1 Tax=Streptomyces spiralis TaxID=66376 RepID=UPI0033CA5403
MYLVTCDTRLDALVVAPESAADLSDETRAVIESADFTRRPDIEAFTRPGRAPKTAAWIALRLGRLGQPTPTARARRLASRARPVGLRVVLVYLLGDGHQLLAG